MEQYIVQFTAPRKPGPARCAPCARWAPTARSAERERDYISFSAPAARTPTASTNRAASIRKPPRRLTNVAADQDAEPVRRRGSVELPPASVEGREPFLESSERDGDADAELPPFPEDDEDRGLPGLQLLDELIATPSPGRKQARCGSAETARARCRRRRPQADARRTGCRAARTRAAPSSRFETLEQMVRPTSSRSSAVTLWTSAHTSEWRRRVVAAHHLPVAVPGLHCSVTAGASARAWRSFGPGREVGAITPPDASMRAREAAVQNARALRPSVVAPSYGGDPASERRSCSDSKPCIGRGKESVLVEHAEPYCKVGSSRRGKRPKWDLVSHPCSHTHCPGREGWCCHAVVRTSGHDCSL